MIVTWFAQLDRAKTVSEAIAVTRDFLATWSLAELKLLPVDCRPGRIRDEQDVEALHSALVDAYRTTRASGEELEALQRHTSFVVRASIRISELSGPVSETPGGGPQDGPGRSLAPPES